MITDKEAQEIVSKLETEDEVLALLRHLKIAAEKDIGTEFNRKLVLGLEATLETIEGLIK